MTEATVSMQRESEKDVFNAKQILKKTLSELSQRRPTMFSPTENNQLQLNANISVKEEPDSFEQYQPTPSPSPKKRMKRRRHDDDGGSDYLDSYHDKYVMKLFERSVDLAQFREDSPLYPVCRAWVQDDVLNQAKKEDGSESGDDIQEDDSDEAFVYSLPRPVTKGRTMFKVPPPVQHTGEKLDNFFSKDGNLTPKEEPSKQELFASYKTHWKQTKENWMSAYRKRDEHYARSLHIIRSIYYKTLHDENT